MSNHSLLIKNTTIYAIGDICPKLVGLIIFPILTSHLSVSEYGIINYINTLDVFLSTFSILGLNTYFMVFYYRVNTEDEKKRLLGNISIAVFLFTIIICLLLHVLGPYIFQQLGSNVDFYPYISLGILINMCNVVTYLPTCLYRVQERPLPLTVLNVLKSILIMIGSALVVTIIPGQAFEVLQVRFIISLLFAVVFILSVRQHTKWNINIPQLKHALKFSIPLLPGTLSYYIFSLSDRILIDKFLSLKDLGIYSTAATLALMLNIISSGAYKAFEPYFFQHIKDSDFSQRFQKVRDWLLVIVLFCAACLSVYAKDFFVLFSSMEYWDSYRYVPVIMIGVVASSISLMYSTIIIAKEKTVANTLITMLGAIVSIVLNIIFLPKLGIIAASVNFSISFIVVLGVSIKVSKIKLSHFRAWITSIIVVGLTFIGAYAIQFDDFFMTITIKALYLILIGAISCLCLGINPVKLISVFQKNKQ